MESIFLHISETELVIFVGLLIVFAYQVYYYLRYLVAPLRLQRKQNLQFEQTAPQKSNEQFPPVSVVICAKNEGENLQTFLPKVLQQAYPCYEVIVVNDGSEDNTADVLSRFAQEYDNLHITFVPKQAQMRSSKKLALTLAAKAAKYDYLLLTDADCYPASENWITQIMQGFKAPKTEIVLAYGAYQKEKTLTHYFVQYDTLFNALQYLGLAIAHHPYMGVGRNLAYRKATFFAHNGFAGLLGTRAGDDDLFVNKVATRKNTAVVLTQQSLTWSIPKHSFTTWLAQKERHLGVSHLYKPSTKIRLLAEPLSRGLFYLLLVLLCIYGTLQQRYIIAIGILLLRFVLQASVLNTAAYRWKGQYMGLGIVFFDIFLPLNNLFLLLRYRYHKRKRTENGW